MDTTTAVEDLPDLNAPSEDEAARALRTGTDDRVVDGSEKVLTKSTSPYAFLGHPIAPTPLASEDQCGLAEVPDNDLSSYKTKVNVPEATPPDNE